MVRSARATAGTLCGAALAAAAVWAALWLAWATRQRWWPPDGDDLQYFGLMVQLWMAGLVLPLPAAIVGGAVGYRLAVADAEPAAAADGGA